MNTSRSLTLEPPPSFEPARQFNGFVRPRDRASIVLRDLPAEVDELTSGFEDKQRAAQEGLQLLGLEELEIDGRRARLFAFLRECADGVLHQWTLAIGEGDRAALVTATVPAISVAEDDERALRAALGRVHWRPEMMDKLFSGAGFQLETGAFTYARRVGEMVLLRDHPTSSNMNGALMAGPSSSEGVCIVNRERFAIKRLHDSVVRVFELQSHSPLKVAGLHGYRTVAVVESLDEVPVPEDEDDASEHEPPKCVAAQVVLFPETDYFVFWSEMELDDKDSLERFDTAVRSFTRVGDQGSPVLDESLPLAEAPDLLAEAFALALHHEQEGASALGERFARAHPEMERRWADAYAAEAWFLRHNVEMLAPLMTGDPGTPMHLPTTLRRRFPGFDEATYSLAISHGARLQHG